MKTSLIPFILLALFGSAQAEEIREHVKYVRGVDGLVNVPLSLRNDGPLPMVCATSIAHWYSLELGKAAANESVAVDLWSNPRTGEVFVLNEEQYQMPVQMLWCGLAGKSWETRSDIVLDRRAGKAPEAMRMGCAQSDGHVRCAPL